MSGHEITVWTAVAVLNTGIDVVSGLTLEEKT
jgi:hypothetical protein